MPYLFLGVGAAKIKMGGRGELLIGVGIINGIKIFVCKYCRVAS